jgi:hypothetical protein
MKVDSVWMKTIHNTPTHTYTIVTDTIRNWGYSNVYKTTFTKFSNICTLEGPKLEGFDLGFVIFYKVPIEKHGKPGVYMHGRWKFKMITN